ncbi:major facilitator superfamily domain-containing protein [Pilaira anomala]|nr:major facilitator superfamily domain-containing protein [Pilaira anomala]
MDPEHSSDVKQILELSRSLHEQEKIYRHYKQSKTILRDLNRYSEEAPKLLSTLQDMRSIAKTKRRRLEQLEDELIKNIKDKLVSAVDIISKFEPSKVPPDDLANIFCIKPHLEKLAPLNEELDKLKSGKMDVQLAKEIKDDIQQKGIELQFDLDTYKLKLGRTQTQYLAEMDVINTRMNQFEDLDIINQIISQFISNEPLTISRDIESPVKDTVRSIIYQKVLEYLIDKQKTLYPSSVVTSLQIRDSNLDKVKSMKEETEAIFETIERMQCSVNNLRYADHITKNHTEVLNFLNEPLKQPVNQIPHKDAKEIPPEISLCGEDVNISTALAASIVKYTENLYFSDLEKRYDRNKKLMDSLQLNMPRYMVYCVLVSCLGSFSNGWVIGSANVPGEITHACKNGLSHVYSRSFPDCLPMNNALWGFAVSSFCVGGLIGGLFGGTIQTKFGRKKTIIFNNLGWIIGALLIGSAMTPAMFIVGRIACGLSCGLGSLTTPTYVGEISTINARGMMGTMNQFAIVIGILLASVIGLPLDSVPLWRINYAIVAIPAILQFFLMAGCVESPRYLVSVNRVEEARLALESLRPNSNIDQEFYDMMEAQLGTAAARAMAINNAKAMEVMSEEKLISKPKAFDSFSDSLVEDVIIENALAGDSEGRESMNMIQIFKDPLIRRITLTVVTLHITQQLIGMNAVMYYSTTIFKMSFSAEMSKYMAIVTTVVNFVSTIISLLLIDRMGRRPLLLIAETGACIFSVLLIVGYVYNIGALLVVSVFGYVLSFAIGIGPIPWMMTSELTPVYASSAVGSVATATNWAMNFLIGQCFPVIFAGIKGYSFAIFASIAAFAFVFTYFKVPETKGRSLEDIVRGFERS